MGHADNFRSPWADFRAGILCFCAAAGGISRRPAWITEPSSPINQSFLPNHHQLVTLFPTAPAQTQTTNTTRRPLRRPKYPSTPHPILTLNDGSLMARPQTRKRQRADEPSRADIDPPAKKTKTRSEVELEAWASWEYPPEFWDRLSKISLSHGALKELDRRTRTRRCDPSPPSPPTSPSRRVFSRATTSRELARFARHGGPDLRDLRGASRYELSLRSVFLTSPYSTPTHQSTINTPSP